MASSCVMAAQGGEGQFIPIMGPYFSAQASHCSLVHCPRAYGWSAFVMAANKRGSSSCVDCADTPAENDRDKAANAHIFLIFIDFLLICCYYYISPSTLYKQQGFSEYYQFIIYRQPDFQNKTRHVHTAIFRKTGRCPAAFFLRWQHTVTHLMFQAMQY